MSHPHHARLCIVVLFGLLQIHRASRFQVAQDDVRDEDCIKAVPGTRKQSSYWGRSQNCECIAKDHVIHGPPACWGATGFEQYFRAEELLGKGCQCMAKGSVEAPGVFAKWDWHQRASELCGSSDAKVVYWIRHAAGAHQNYAYTNAFLVQDPDLTDAGRAQAKNLHHAPNIAAALYNATQRAQLVIASPMRRTMATAILGFNNSLIDVPWLLDPDIQEVPGYIVCNTGNVLKGKGLLSSYGRKDLLNEYKNLDPSWTNRKSGRFVDKLKLQRFQDFTARLEQRHEERIIVVSHGWFMRPLGKNSPGSNCGVKPFALCDGKWHFLG